MNDMGAGPLLDRLGAKANVSAGPGNKKAAAAPTIVGFAGGSAGMADCPATAPWLCAAVFRRLYSGQRTARESSH